MMELLLDVDGHGSVSFPLSKITKGHGPGTFGWSIEFVDLPAWDAFCARKLITRNMRIMVDGKPLL